VEALTYQAINKNRRGPKVGKKSKKNEFDLDRIDKLLAQFPDEEPEPAKPQVKSAKPALPSGKPEGAAGPASAGKIQRTASPLTAWMRVLAGVVLALAMTQWPYGYGCGFGLAAYMIATTGLLFVGAWAAVYTWRARLGIPHLIALGVSLWGLTLTGHQVLRRVGYAKAEATWTCVAQVQTPTPAVPPAGLVPEQAVVAPADSVIGDSAAAADSIVPADSATQVDSTVPGDSVTPADTVPRDTIPQSDSLPTHAWGLRL
jgi:hypothetical protein